jgi:putative sigma-54 modulation protein
MVDKSKFAEEDAQGYRLEIIGRNVLVTEAMKNYVRDKLAKIGRFHTHIMDMHVTLDIQRIEHVVVILLTFEHFTIKVHASSTDMYASIDKAIDRLQKQLSRWKGKMQDYHKKDIATIDMQVNVVRRPFDEVDEFNHEIEHIEHEKGFFPPQVVKTKVIPLKNLNIEEAVMKMELSGDHFLLFKGEEDKKLKVIYRRPDGNYGIIAAE